MPGTVKVHGSGLNEGNGSWSLGAVSSPPLGELSDTWYLVCLFSARFRFILSQFTQSSLGCPSDPTACLHQQLPPSTSPKGKKASYEGEERMHHSDGCLKDRMGTKHKGKRHCYRPQYLYEFTILRSGIPHRTGIYSRTNSLS